jgi:hypothetical protein
VIGMVEPDMKRRPITLQDIRWSVAALLAVVTLAGLAFALMERIV